MWQHCLYSLTVDNVEKEGIILIISYIWHNLDPAFPQCGPRKRCAPAVWKHFKGSLRHVVRLERREGGSRLAAPKIGRKVCVKGLVQADRYKGQTLWDIMRYWLLADKVFSFLSPEICKKCSVLWFIPGWGLSHLRASADCRVSYEWEARCFDRSYTTSKKPEKRDLPLRLLEETVSEKPREEQVIAHSSDTNTTWELLSVQIFQINEN